MTNTVVERYQEWKDVHDEDVYESIEDFFSSLPKGDLLSIINYLIKTNYEL